MAWENPEQYCSNRLCALPSTIQYCVIVLTGGDYNFMFVLSTSIHIKCQLVTTRQIGIFCLHSEIINRVSISFEYFLTL